MVSNNNTKPTLTSLIIGAVDESAKSIHANMIAVVTKVNAKTINCKPVMSQSVDGEKKDLPEFAEVPVINLSGGSSSIKFPVKAGDYCLLFVNDVCFDGWYNGQDFEEPLESRKHDYSDAIAIVGINNQKGAMNIPDDIEINGDVTHNGSMTINGNLEVTGTVTSGGDMTISGKSFLTHSHPADNQPPS